MLKFINKIKGFSLIELILSMGIFAIGVVYVLQAMSYSSKVTTLSSRMVEAVFLSQDLLQEIEFKSLSNISFSDEQKDENSNFQWQYMLSKNSDLNLTDLDLKLNFKSGQFKNDIHIITYLLNENKT